MKLKELFDHFILEKEKDLKAVTIDLYKRIYEHHFYFLNDRVVENFTSKTIDEWLQTLQDKNTNKQRYNFNHELDLMKNIISHYNEFFDGELRIFKQRHLKLAKVKNKNEEVSKEFPENEFKKFLGSIGILYGEKYYMLALIQYYEALRISEAYALHYSDFHMSEDPFSSYVVIQRSVVFTHNSKKKSYIQKGFKNRKQKELPLIPEVWIFLKNHLEAYKDKYLFMPNGIPEEYHTIQRAYNTAFKCCQLPYRSTHILRHGGASRIYNLSGGNVICASQLLGNTEKETLKTYAHPYRNTLQMELKKMYETLCQEP